MVENTARTAKREIGPIYEAKQAAGRGFQFQKKHYRDYIRLHIASLKETGGFFFLLATGGGGSKAPGVITPTLHARGKYF